MARRDRHVVVDSDVVIVLRGDAEVASTLKRAFGQGAVALTPITIAEVLSGARPAEEARTRVLLASLDCLRIDRHVGEMAARFVARYGRSHAVEIADSLVAACAVVHGYSLWTLNRKHYPMRDVRFFA